jgi:predicted dehydrogenase
MPRSRAAVPSLLIVGAGDRGSAYGRYLLEHPEEGRLAGVADPDPVARDRLADAAGLPAARRLRGWREALSGRRIADAVVIATPDREHAAPAVAFATAGWPILLEKPMAPTAAECRAVVRAVERAGVLFAVCHVLRYTAYTARLRALVGSGAIGEVVGLSHLEPVGWWHFAHSYVRGNWRRGDLGSSVLMAKSCHDIDWIRFLLGAPCERVTSFGARMHFRPESRPAGAADRCVHCAIETNCAYSAVRLYGERAQRGDFAWPVSVLGHDRTAAGVERALRTGPYGRCVYACDNDVLDHQVVALEHAGAKAATFTLSAFTPFTARRSTVFGTRGWLVGDGSRLEHHDFLTDHRTVEEVTAPGNHGGGDDALMFAFLAALREEDPSYLRASAAETLETHLTVFAAERARVEGRVVRVAEWLDGTEERD